MYPELKYKTMLALAAGLAAALPAPAAGEAERLPEVSVMAGQFPAGDQPGAVLGSLEVATTPGTQADIGRMIQTLPGVQFVDEGNALFVRGGDSFETQTLVNGLVYPATVRLGAPVGNFSGTLDPFETRRIDFESGGFGARYGNALSGIVDLDTNGRPPSDSVTVGAGLSAVTAGATWAPTDALGFRATATRSDAGPFFALEAPSRDYPEPPNGRDLSATAAWAYRSGAEVKFFAVDQTKALALTVAPPYAGGLYSQSNSHRLETLSWKDGFGRWSPEVDVGAARSGQEQAVAGTFVDTEASDAQFAARTGYDASGALELSGGADGWRQEASLAKAQPASAGAPAAALAGSLAGSRWGAFAEADLAATSRLRVVAGLRRDVSTLTGRATVDPRLSLAWSPRPDVGATLAGGVYHQEPSAYDFFSGSGRRSLPAMRDSQVVAGVKVGSDDQFFRVEAYAKDYAHLVQLDRDYLPVAGGTGRAAGFDFFAKTPLPGLATGRLTYSFTDSRRTDPDTGLMARAPFGVAHSVSLIVQRAFGGWICGAAWRYASGKPFTPIVGGEPDGAGGFLPLYGAPFSDRLPPLERLDLSASRYWRIGSHLGLVTYLAVTNALNRANVYAYQYPADYSARHPTPSLFNRSLYAGFTLNYHR